MIMQVTQHRVHIIEVAVTRIGAIPIVFDAGRICEQGSHEQLIANQGLYYKLYEQQLAAGDLP